MRRILRRFSAQNGFTLAESLVAIGIMTVCLTMVGSPLVNALRHDADWRDSITATTALQRINAYIARDAIKAETISLVSGGDAVSTVTLDWEDLGGVPRSATYSLVGSDLVRTFDGQDFIVARGVTLIQFTRSSNLITFTVSVEAAGTVNVKTATHLLRSLQ